MLVLILKPTSKVVYRYDLYRHMLLVFFLVNYLIFIIEEKIFFKLK
jgi:hypothetical protein